MNKPITSKTLRQLIDERGLTLADLSKLTTIPDSTLSAYQTGARKPTIHKCCLIAAALGVSLKTLAIALGCDVSDIPDDIENSPSDGE